MRKIIFVAAIAALTFSMSSITSCVSAQRKGLARGERKMQPRRNQSTDEAWQKQTQRLLKYNKVNRDLEVEEAKLKRQEEVAYEQLPPKKRARKQIRRPPFDFH